MPPLFLPFAVKLMALHLLLLTQHIAGPLRFFLALCGLPRRIVVLSYPLK